MLMMADWYSKPPPSPSIPPPTPRAHTRTVKKPGLLTLRSFSKMRPQEAT